MGRVRVAAACGREAKGARQAWCDRRSVLRVVGGGLPPVLSAGTGPIRLHQADAAVEMGAE